MWTDINEVPAQYPWLDRDIVCDVCVVGGGITGVMCALRLAQSGADTVLITENRIGSGATADTMPCVEYDFGHTLHSLRKRLESGDAIELMRMGERALGELTSLVAELGGDCGFALRDSMIFTGDMAELSMLNNEFLVRKRAGFDCSYISRSSAADVFSFDIAGAIVSKGLAAQLDPYRLTHLCAARAHDMGVRIFENTKADLIECEGDVYIETSTRRLITARKTVVAAGGACGEILGGQSVTKSAFMVASEPVERLASWPGRCVIRTWNEPTVTVAASPDNRICAGGLASASVDEEGRLFGIIPAHKLCNRRFEDLREMPGYLFPETEIGDFEFARVSRYTETPDRLPIIGEAPEAPGCIFALCSAPNAVLMSMIAAPVVTSLCADAYPEEAEFFSAVRKSLSR